jgi:hypothetical protein
LDFQHLTTEFGLQTDFPILGTLNFFLKTILAFDKIGASYKGKIPHFKINVTDFLYPYRPI